jgi:hypothetical protein
MRRNEPAAQNAYCLVERRVRFPAAPLNSIRSQIRKLFASLLGVDAAEATKLQRRALCVYDKRSTLVHDGHLPNEELFTLEGEARELLEKLFASAIEEAQ